MSDCIFKGFKGQNLEYREAALETVMRAASVDGSCGGPWSHELTAVVSKCAVVANGTNPVLQVNPAWLAELAARGQLRILVEEMRTWFALQDEIARSGSQDRTASVAA